MCGLVSGLVGCYLPNAYPHHYSTIVSVQLLGISLNLFICIGTSYIRSLRCFVLILVNNVRPGHMYVVYACCSVWFSQSSLFSQFLVDYDNAVTRLSHTSSL